MKSLQKTLVFVIQSVIIGLAAAFVVVYLRPDLLDSTRRGNFNLAGLQGSGPSSYADAVRRSAPSVVNIHSAKHVGNPANPLLNDPVLQRYFGNQLQPQQRIQTTLGSGVIVSSDGFILTNHHLIDGAEEILVAMSDGRIVQAKIVGTDPDTDLALLQLPLDGLPVIPMGMSNDLQVGDVVLAIGNPFGVGQTVTQGIVSATGRNQLGLTTFENFIQTDAAINPGNSGGALVNARGQLVGVNTAIFSRDGQSNGIGFAVPVNLARGVMNQLAENGRVIRGWLGGQIIFLSPIRKELDFQEHRLPPILKETVNQK